MYFNFLVIALAITRKQTSRMRRLWIKNKTKWPSFQILIIKYNTQYIANQQLKLKVQRNFCREYSLVKYNRVHSALVPRYSQCIESAVGFRPYVHIGTN